MQSYIQPLLSSIQLTNEWLLDYIMEHLPVILGTITNICGQCYMILYNDQTIAEYICGLKKMSINQQSTNNTNIFVKLTKYYKIIILILSVSTHTYIHKIYCVLYCY